MSGMARVKKFIDQRTRSLPHPTEVDVRHQIVESADGPLLQITTFGSKFRETKPKPSQTLQFDRAAAATMIDLLESTFPDLRGRRVLPHRSDLKG